MNLSEFRTAHSIVMEHYQFIEMPLEGIYATLSGRSFYYKNSLLYVKASKQRYDIWNEYMICQDINKLKNLCEMGENIDDAHKLLRCQGIDLLTSDKIMRNIGHIVNRDEAIWFNEKNRNILLMFNKGFIEINGIEMPIDHLRFLYGQKNT